MVLNELDPVLVKHLPLDVKMDCGPDMDLRKIKWKKDFNSIFWFSEYGHVFSEGRNILRKLNQNKSFSKISSNTFSVFFEKYFRHSTKFKYQIRKVPYSNYDSICYESLTLKRRCKRVECSRVI